MLFPGLIYYCGLHLKETVMVFILIVFINSADKLFKAKKIKYLNALLLIIAAGSLFLFRTVLAVSAIFAFITASFFISKRISGWGRRIIIIPASLIYR